MAPQENSYFSPLVPPTADFGQGQFPNPETGYTPPAYQPYAPANPYTPQEYEKRSLEEIIASLPSYIQIDENGNKVDTRQYIDPPSDDTNGAGVYAAGGDVQLNTGMGQAQIAGGGIANIPTEVNAPIGFPDELTPMDNMPLSPARQFNRGAELDALGYGESVNEMEPPQQPMAQAGGEPTQQDIQMLAMALTGQAGEQADQIIEVFVQKFGPEMFQEARDFILKTMGGQNAQTEGMVQGQGGGMDDQVMGTIGGQQRHRVVQQRQHCLLRLRGWLVDWQQVSPRVSLKAT